MQAREKKPTGKFVLAPLFSPATFFFTAGEGKCNPRPCPAAIPFLSLSKTPPAQFAFSVSLPPPTFFWQTPSPPFSFQLVRKKETVQKKEPLPSYNPSAHDNVWSVRGHHYSLPVTCRAHCALYSSDGKSVRNANIEKYTAETILIPICSDARVGDVKKIQLLRKTALSFFVGEKKMQIYRARREESRKRSSIVPISRAE